VVRYFDNILAPIHCVSVKEYQACSQEPVCRFRRVFLEIRNLTARLMEQATLADVYAGRPLSNQPVNEQAWQDGGGI
jgi:DNA-binding IscR family transcriptional regulator